MSQKQLTVSELVNQKKAKEQKLADKKLELLMSMYHKLTYAKVLRMAIDSGIVKLKSPVIIEEFNDNPITANKAEKIKETITQDNISANESGL